MSAEARFPCPSFRGLGIIAVGLSMLLTACAGGSATPSPTAVSATQPSEAAQPAASPVAMSSPAASPAAGGPASANGTAVRIQSFAYQPQELAVPVGTTVIWTNEDDTPHTVTADDHAFDSGLFSKGGTFSHTFTAPGRYPYFCIPHGSPGSGMFGTVVVT